MEIYVVVDVSGNLVSCLFIVMVIDLEEFVFVCFDNIVVLIDIMECVVVVIYVDFEGFDNCLGIIVI